MTESHADNMYRTVSGFEPATPLIRSERVTTVICDKKVIVSKYLGYEQ